MRTIALVMLLAMLSISQTLAAGAGPSIRDDEWKAYRAAFVAENGRVIDSGNNGISHSESQGYGMLLAVLANDRPTFEAIWSFTRTELMVRDDGLAAWRWEADANPHVTDLNNASDGDMLIAYALGLAGEGWNDQAKTEAARAIVTKLRSGLLTQVDDMLVTLPGKEGFDRGQRPDGPVVNPSYWIWETRPLFQKLDPEGSWPQVGEDEMRLLAATHDNKAGLPPDWVSLANERPVPAEGFPPEFGYNNIRVPLYLLRVDAPVDQLHPFMAMVDEQGLKRVDVTTGEVKEYLGEPGYRLVGAALACKVEGTPVPVELLTFSPSSYYAATLQLLTLDYLRRDTNGCLEKEG